MTSIWVIKRSRLEEAGRLIHKTWIFLGKEVEKKARCCRGVTSDFGEWYSREMVRVTLIKGERVGFFEKLF